jgi:nucleoside-diphosphate-sugar epimerase
VTIIKMRALLVTGATGFIGSHIVSHLLDRGDSVRALIRPGRAKPAFMLEAEEISWSYGDLTDPASLRSATGNVAVVYHAAALLHAPHNSHAMREVNVTGVKNLLDACIHNQVERFVFISSVEAYAPSQAVVIREDAPLGGSGVYGHTKAEAEALVKSYADSFGLAYSIIRPCVVYGERDYNNFTPRLLRLLRWTIIPVVAGNPAHMTLVYAADVAEAVILAGTHPNAVGQAYNITGGRPTSLQELAKIHEELSGQRKLLIPVPISLLRTALLIRWLVSNLRHRRFERMMKRYRDREYQRSVFLRRHQHDISKARTELGYEPSIDLREGLRRTVAWYESR